MAPKALRRFRKASVPAFAKLNLSLSVFNRRPDGYHELRTVFQTISLADRLELSFDPGRGIAVSLSSVPDIPGNLAARAATLAMEASGARGTLTGVLNKRTPLGAGLGGGSSDAAAVLLAFPALTGRVIPPDDLHFIASTLGSDVPFFLYGGTAIGCGRGGELYPVPTPSSQHALVVAPGIHVSTAEAYQTLDRAGPNELTPLEHDHKMRRFQSLAWSLACPGSSSDWRDLCENDFEAAVFQPFPLLQSLRDTLQTLGARPARMTGSGSALFGLFASAQAAQRAGRSLRQRNPEVEVFQVSFLSGARYRAAWRRALASYVDASSWPPRPR